MTKTHRTLKLLLLSLALMFTLNACAINTTYPGTMNVVEASKVAEDAASESKIVVIDARGQEAYDKGHLKGAICLSPAELVIETPVPNMLASKAQVEKALGDKGITSDSTVYIYDDNGGVNAGRIWWTLKVYGHEKVMLINGGPAALAAEKLEMTREATVLPEAVYTAKEADAEMISSYEDVEALVASADKNVKILDVRSVAEYEAGYIPGAILYPHTKNLYADGTFMSSRDLGLFYKDLGLKKDDAIIVYCKTSFRATQTVALLQEAGYENLRIYDGAWLEWASRADVTVPPVEGSAPVGESDGS